jgi:ribosomal protein S18 acetylase RimI-like enzyme
MSFELTVGAAASAVPICSAEGVGPAPAGREASTVTLRHATPADEPLLFALFTEEKSLQWSGVNWDKAQLKPLLEMQYRARSMAYRGAFPQATQWIIEAKAGSPVGQVLRNEDELAIRIVDITVANAWRGQGIGKFALKSMQDEAARQGKRIELQVAAGSVAKRLYLRLGFKKVSGDHLMEQMVWNL